MYNWITLLYTWKLTQHCKSTIFQLKKKVNPYVYGQLVLDEDVKTIQSGKNNFSTNGAETAAYPQAEEWIWMHTSHHTQKLAKKWIKDLNIRAETIKLLGKNIGVSHHDLALGMVFSDMTTEGKAITQKIVTLTSSKLDTFVHQRTLSRKWRDNMQNGRKYCKLYIWLGSNIQII